MSHIYKTAEEMESALKDGYVFMSDINLEEAEYGLTSDNDALRTYENFMECETD